MAGPSRTRTGFLIDIAGDTLTAGRVRRQECPSLDGYARSMVLLPLFPLGTVLLPGAALPLQIFEPRYVALLEDLAHQPAEPRAFGIVAIRQGHEVGAGAATELHDVGCEAVIEGPVVGIRPPFHLVARGGRRFRLDGVDATAGPPYLVGEVTWLDEAPPAAEGDLDHLEAQLRAAHAAYARALGAEPALIPAAPVGELAYRVVERSALTLADRQEVLAAPCAADRLRTTLRILRTETALLTQLRAVPGAPDPGQSSPN